MDERQKVVICSAVRSPIGKFQGCYTSISAFNLGSLIIEEVINRAQIRKEDVEQVIIGHVLTSNCGQNPARQAAIGAGLPNTIPAYVVNMVCGSGLKSVILGYQAIKCGDAMIVVAGGQENMTQSPHGICIREAKRMGDDQLIDLMLKDGLMCSINHIHMVFMIPKGITAENIAKSYLISREEQDNFALLSQHKAENAQKTNLFQKEILPIVVNSQKVDLGKIVIKNDEYIRQNLTIEGLKKLKPCFIQDETGSVTAGNSSGINDGAAAVVLMNQSEAKKRGIPELATIISWAECGVDPKIMGMGPVIAIRTAISKAGWTIDQVDLFELNEAFAVQSLAVIKELEINQSKVNINGGSIALGHPIGASGCRILVTLIYALQQQRKRRGVAALCVGGGMGIAICIEVHPNEIEHDDKNS